jgi:hypothetical protein
MHLKLLAGFIVTELLWWVEAQSTCEVVVPGLATALSQEISLREQVPWPS